MKTGIVSVLVLALVSVVGAGYLAVRGIGAAAGYALGAIEPMAGYALSAIEPSVRQALPPELAPALVQERLDRVLALVRDGRVDTAALRDTLLWLPGALFDGQLDAAEIDALAAKLDRVIAAPAPEQTET